MAMDVRLDSSGEEIVLYFDIETEGLHAQTFGNALLAFDEVYRAINAVINPGVEVEIEFLRSDRGSVRAVLKALTKDTSDLITHPVSLIIFPFLLSIFVNWLTVDHVTIIVKDDSYIVEHDGERIVLPRGAEHKAKRAVHDPAVRRSVKNFFAVVDSDPSVKSVDFRPASSPSKPTIPIQRAEFKSVLTSLEVVLPEPETERKQVHRRQSLIVLTAALESSKRKWQFLWNGVKIWADITDPDFFSKVAAHDYEFGHGDQLLVDLEVDQELNKLVGAYENRAYHVLKVHSQTKGSKQLDML